MSFQGHHHFMTFYIPMWATGMSWDVILKHGQGEHCISLILSEWCILGNTNVYILFSITSPTENPASHSSFMAPSSSLILLDGDFL